MADRLIKITTALAVAAVAAVAAVISHSPTNEAPPTTCHAESSELPQRITMRSRHVHSWPAGSAVTFETGGPVATGLPELRQIAESGR